MLPGLHHRALYAFEDFLISRFHMFLMVYFHYKSVVFDEMFGQYLETPGCDYQLPADIESYVITTTPTSQPTSREANPWARRISDKTPYRMLIELHSGIPQHKTHAGARAAAIAHSKGSQGARHRFPHKTSTGELSKYFRKPGDPIFVRYDNHYSKPSFIPIEQCTDLFQRYSEKRTITRFTSLLRIIRGAAIRAGARHSDLKITKKNPLA